MKSHVTQGAWGYYNWTFYFWGHCKSEGRSPSICLLVSGSGKLERIRTLGQLPPLQPPELLRVDVCNSLSLRFCLCTKGILLVQISEEPRIQRSQHRTREWAEVEACVKERPSHCCLCANLKKEALPLGHFISLCKKESERTRDFYFLKCG